MTIAGTIPATSYLLIIGAMKCGTSSLFDYLSRHPAICPSTPKEPEYFSDRKKHDATGACYEDLWSFDPQVHRYAMEASTGYTKQPQDDIAVRIHTAGLRPKLIYLIRDPIERIESHFNFMKKVNPAHWNLALDSDHLLNTTRYFSHAEKFASVFGRDALLVDTLENLIQSEANFVNKIFQFLNLPAAFNESTVPQKNATSRVQSMAFRELLGRTPSGVRRLVPTPLKRSGRWLDRQFNKGEPARLSATQRDDVRRRLRMEMAALRKIYGIDTARWGFD